MITMDNLKGGSMVDQKKVDEIGAIGKITPELNKTLNETRNTLESSDRRMFMAKIVRLMGPGGQRRAEREFGWHREAIVKGEKELSSGFRCIDNFSGRGRKPAEHHLPDLLDDIKSIVEPASQADPTFRTDQSYCPLTAGQVRRRLIEEMEYSETQVPKERTIRSKLNQLGFKPQIVAKAKHKNNSRDRRYFRQSAQNQQIVGRCGRRDSIKHRYLGDCYNWAFFQRRLQQAGADGCRSRFRAGGYAQAFRNLHTRNGRELFLFYQKQCNRRFYDRRVARPLAIFEKTLQSAHNCDQRGQRS